MIDGGPKINYYCQLSKLSYKSKSSYPFSRRKIFSPATGVFDKRELGHYFSTSACKTRRSATSDASLWKSRRSGGNKKYPRIPCWISWTLNFRATESTRKKQREQNAEWNGERGDKIFGVGFYARTTSRYRGWRRKHRSRGNPYAAAYTYTHTRERPSARRERFFGGENVLYKGGWSLIGLRLYVKAFRRFSCRSTNSGKRPFVARRLKFFLALRF